MRLSLGGETRQISQGSFVFYATNFEGMNLYQPEQTSLTHAESLECRCVVFLDEEGHLQRRGAFVGDVASWFNTWPLALAGWLALKSSQLLLMVSESPTLYSAVGGQG